MTALPRYRLPRSARFIACSFALALSGFAQETLTGTISNAATGQNLAGARVVLKGTGREVLTDSTGTYRFDNVAPGTATVSASYTGLNPADQTINVRAGERNRLDVGLTSDIYQLSSFVVSGEREGMAQAITLQRNSDGIRSDLDLAERPGQASAHSPFEGEAR